MGRKPLSDSSASVLERFRLPLKLREAFQAQAAARGRSRSEVLRALIERWLREVRKVERLRDGAEGPKP